MLLEISGEITSERMKGWSQSKNNTQLWMGLVIEARSNAVKYIHMCPHLWYHPLWVINNTESYICGCSVQFSSVTQSCPTLCDPMNHSTPGLPVHHQLSEFTQTHVHRVGDAIQPSHPLSPPSPPAFNLSQHLGLFKWVSSSHQVAEVLEFQLQYQSFQWTLRADFL